MLCICASALGSTQQPIHRRAAAAAAAAAAAFEINGVFLEVRLHLIGLALAITWTMSLEWMTMVFVGGFRAASLTASVLCASGPVPWRVSRAMERTTPGGRAGRG